MGQAVRSRRRDLGLRQAELAELAGCSRKFLSTIEGGKPGVRLDKLLDVLDAVGRGLSIRPGRGDITEPVVGADGSAP